MSLLSLKSGAASAMVAQPERKPDLSPKQLAWLRRRNPGFRYVELCSKRAASHPAQVRAKMGVGNA